MITGESLLMLNRELISLVMLRFIVLRLTSSQLVAAPLDGAPEGTNVVGIYTWLKSSGSFTILNVDEEGNEINYGKGDVVASTPAETVALAAGGTAFHCCGGWFVLCSYE